MLRQAHPDHAAALLKGAQAEVNERWKLYEYLAAMPGPASKIEAKPDDEKSLSKGAAND
jgi:hypothetical protein